MDRAVSALPITEVATTSEAELLNPVPGRRMDLPGFDAEFVDFPDYIVRITDRIWHQRQVEKCLDYYTADCAIHTLAGDIVGADTVVANTHATLDSFPDRHLNPDNVIWSDDGEGRFYSSHLINSPMTNLGPTEFGPPTGKAIKVITIADCACRDNRIYEEWLARDYAAMALQLGHDPQAVAEEQAKKDKAEGFSLIDHHAEEFDAVARMDPLGGDAPEDAASDPRALAEFVLEQIWKAGRADAVLDAYDFRVKATWPGLRSLYGEREILGQSQAVFGCFGNLRFRVDHLAQIPYLGGAGSDIAVRWTMAGDHMYPGIYGEPTGKPAFIMGITHWRIINGRIPEEITIWDDIALRRQLATSV
ncbi:MAG: ester cyclase [Pseudomonadota bacterium]